MSTGNLLPICFRCAHFRSVAIGKGWVCKAFPDGISSDILASRHDHREPYQGDHGITFQPIQASDEYDPNHPENPLTPYTADSAYKKFEKKAAHYVSESPDPAKACGGCYFFTSPNSCSLVAGYINPEGKCIHWMTSPMAADAEFNEADHPRDESGKFSSSGSGGSKIDSSVEKFLKNTWIQSEEEEFDATAFQKFRKDANGEVAKALEKCPKFEGRSFRGVGLTKKELSQFPEGKVFSFDLHSSTSKDVKVAEQFAGDVPQGYEPVIFTIGNNNAADLSGLSGLSEHEQEVVVKKGSKFEVVREPRKIDGVWRIRINQV